MGALSLYESAKRSNNALFQGIALGLVSRDQLAAALPFKTFSGLQMQYLREGVRPTTGFLDDMRTNMQAASAPTFDSVSVPMRSIGSDVEVDTIANAIAGGRDLSAAISAKVLSTWDLVRANIIRGGHTTSHTLGLATDPFSAITAMEYGPWLDSDRFGAGEILYDDGTTSWSFRAPGDRTFGTAVVAAADGTYTLKSDNQSKWIQVTLDVSNATQDGRTWIEFASSTNSFDGLETICAPSQVIDPTGGNGDDISLGLLNKLLRMERVRKNRVIIMSGGMLLKYLELVSVASNITPENLTLPGYSGVTHVYRGTPILECDEILDNEVVGGTSTCSSIYVASLDVDDGLFMGVPGTGSSAIDVEGDPRTSAVMGWLLQGLSPSPDAPRDRGRVLWSGALGLRNNLALARARGIKAG